VRQRIGHVESLPEEELAKVSIIDIFASSRGRLEALVEMALVESLDLPDVAPKRAQDAGAFAHLLL
jgi:hypothetical protein